MKTSLGAALVYTFAMGGLIFFCRAFPFLFFREKKDASRGGEKSGGGEHNRPAGREKAGGKGRSRRELFLTFVEKLVPPAAMTVLAVNAIAGPLKTNLREGIPVLAAAGLTALVHLRKRNPLLSIFGGVAAYMILKRLLMP
ncbi:MAG: AzlD domain-containing protein [Treponema sp.]|nr:AzlD domain-containing protein [Treponema sp.]